MKCPHCLENFFPVSKIYPVLWPDDKVAVDANDLTVWRLITTRCPSCLKLVMQLQEFNKHIQMVMGERLVQPKGYARAALSPEVPSVYADDYVEACAVLTDSPKASAALSRRCLQHLLREHAQTKKKDLVDQIAEVAPKLPSYLGEALDAVRKIGNLAAHPLKNTNTGEIVNVEPGEAEWNLDVLEQLFDFYFVQPAILNKKREALNAKLAEAKKPPMK